jgi:hypothetical protein
MADRCGEIAALLEASSAYQRLRPRRSAGAGGLEDRVLRIASGAPLTRRDIRFAGMFALSWFAMDAFWFISTLNHWFGLWNNAPEPQAIVGPLGPLSCLLPYARQHRDQSMIDKADKRGQLIRHLEDALALADEIDDGRTGYLIERALDEARAQQFKPVARRQRD